MRGWLFQIFMPAVGLGQKTPPLALRSLAASSTTASLRAVFSILLSSDLRQPVRVFRVPAVHDVEERQQKQNGDGAARAGAGGRAGGRAGRRGGGGRARGGRGGAEV